LPHITVTYRAVTGPHCAAEKISTFWVREDPVEQIDDWPIPELEAFSMNGAQVIIKNYDAGRADGVVWLDRLTWEQEIVRLYKQWRQKFSKRFDPEPPPPPESEPEAPLEEVEPDEPELSPEDILAAVEQAFRKLAKERHPDRGGDPEAFKKLVEARDAAREFFRGK